MVNGSNRSYDEAMDDIHTRFILNLPDEELRSAPRIFFQLEQAWWFYDDFICDGAAVEPASASEPAAASNTDAESSSGEGRGSETDVGKKKDSKGGDAGPLPRFKHVKPFALAMFGFSPLLRPMLPRFEDMYAEFSSYKRSISTYGTILLNADATKVALCRVYRGKSWTLPGGKVNQGESGRDAAARETYEETGFDPHNERGVCADWMDRRRKGEAVEELQVDEDGVDVDAPSDEEAEKNVRSTLPWRRLQDDDKLVYTENDTNKRRTCYVCRGVPENFPFKPVARKEVSEILWHRLTSLPKHTYAVLPFMSQLKRWIKRDNRRRGEDARGMISRPCSRSGRGEGQDRLRPATSGKAGCREKGLGGLHRNHRRPDDNLGLTHFFSEDGNAPWERTEEVVENEEKSDTQGRKTSGKGKAEASDRKASKDGRRAGLSKKAKRSKSSGTKLKRSNSLSGSCAGSRGRQVSASDPLVESTLASPGEPNRWTEAEMFATNELLLGRKIAYDGNPHDFAEKGFDVSGRGRIDPHTFRVVGGTFMNSDVSGGAVPSASLEVSRLQPLVDTRVRVGSGGGSDVSGLSGEGDPGGGACLALTPFFSDGGKAPWEAGVSLGEMLPVEAARVREHFTPPLSSSNVQPPAGRQSNSKGLALLNRLRQGASANEDGDSDPRMEWSAASKCIPAGKEGDKSARKVKRKKKDNDKTDIGGSSGMTEEDSTDWFMTDREITARSEKGKLSILPPLPFTPSLARSAETASSRPLLALSARTTSLVASPAVLDAQENEHVVFMKQWVQKLPQAGPTKEFGNFSLDVNAIMNAMGAIQS